MFFKKNKDASEEQTDTSSTEKTINKIRKKKLIRTAGISAVVVLSIALAVVFYVNESSKKAKKVQVRKLSGVNGQLSLGPNPMFRPVSSSQIPIQAPISSSKIAAVATDAQTQKQPVSPVIAPNIASKTEKNQVLVTVLGPGAIKPVEAKKPEVTSATTSVQEKTADCQEVKKRTTKRKVTARKVRAVKKDIISTKTSPEKSPMIPVIKTLPEDCNLIGVLDEGSKTSKIYECNGRLQKF